MDEVTEVSSLGGGGLKSKLGTPDVVGTYKKLPGNPIEFPIEIAAAEIKIVPPELKIKRMRPWWIPFAVGVITAGELGLLIGMYSRDGNVWLRWLGTDTTVSSRLDTPKTLTQVASPTAGLPIASADPPPTDGEPPTADLPVASADPQPTDGEPPTADLPVASADPQPTDGEPPTADLPVASADPQPTDGVPPTAGLPIASADPQSNRLPEAEVQAEPAPATVTSSPPQPSQVASVRAGSPPVSEPQSLSAQGGSAARHLDAEEIAALISRGTDSEERRSRRRGSAAPRRRGRQRECRTEGRHDICAPCHPAARRRGVVPNVAQARQWYEKAAELGLTPPRSGSKSSRTLVSERVAKEQRRGNGDQFAMAKSQAISCERLPCERRG